MPARNFCDTCDKMIEDRDSFYDVKISVARQKEHYSFHNHPHSMQIKNEGGQFEYIAIVQEFPMVCQECAWKIRKFIWEL